MKLKLWRWKKKEREREKQKVGEEKGKNMNTRNERFSGEKSTPNESKSTSVAASFLQGTLILARHVHQHLLVPFEDDS